MIALKKTFFSGRLKKLLFSFFQGINANLTLGGHVHLDFVHKPEDWSKVRRGLFLFRISCAVLNEFINDISYRVFFNE